MANITRRDPFNELTSLHNRLSNLLGQSFPGLSRLSSAEEQPLAFTSFVPPVDVYEDEHTITVQAELPGINEKDLDVRVENNVLTISGERRMENEETQENFHRIERSYGKFTRSFSLPNTVDSEHIQAQFENGVLRLSIPKREEAKPKQIKVGIGKSGGTREKAA